MQLLLNIPENCFDIDLSEKDRKIIEDMYDLTQEDKYEIANIGPGADLLVILTTIATFGLSIWNFPTVLKDGLDNWQWLIKKLKSFIKKKELVSLDQDAAGFLAIDYLANKYGEDGNFNLIDAHTFKIIDLGGMLLNQKESLAAHPHNYYVFTFYIAARIVVLSVRSTGEIRELEAFDDMPYGLNDFKTEERVP